MHEEIKSDNITWHHSSLTREDHERQAGHKGLTLWFTGLSGSGKSTLANHVAKELFLTRHRVFVLDADNIRHGLNRDLGFSPEERAENIRRIGEVCKLFTQSGVMILAALISPMLKDRQMVREILGGKDFVEIFIKCSLAVCEERDPKGLYKKARTGSITEFTGISAPYEEPQHPALIVETDQCSLEQCSEKIIAYLSENHYLRN